MIIIPNRQNRTISQLNRGNILGTLWSTFGIELQENLGAIRLARKLKIVTKTGDTNATNLGIPWAFKFFDSRHWSGAGGRIFKNTGQNMNLAFIEDTSTGAVTTYDADFSDMEIFNETLVAVSSVNVYSKASNSSGTGAWTDRTSTLSLGSGTAHITKYFKKTDRLYITDSRQIKSIDTSWAVATSGDYFINLGFSGPVFIISCMEFSSDRAWIGIMRDLSPDGTAHSSGASTFQAEILEWDGISAQITRQHIIKGASAIMAIIIKNDVPTIIDSNGIAREFDGTGFKEINRLPINNAAYLGIPTDLKATNRFLHYNGLSLTENGTILVNICNRNGYLRGTTESVEEALPSGIWELSDENGFIHKNPFTLLGVGSTSITDYGQNRISKPGAIATAKFFTTTGIVNTLFAGCEYYSDATTTVDGIFVASSYPSNNATYPEGQKAGYFTTQWIFGGAGFQTPTVKDTWQKIYSIYKQFLSSTDKIVMKYRIREAVAVEISITWVDTTSFTTSTDLTGKEGYEIEVLQGTGSGKCVHITSITNNAGTYTIVVDDIVTGVTTGTAKARYQNWKKTGVPAQNQYTESHEFPIGKASERVQIKCYMEFTGDNEIYETVIVNEGQQPLK